MVKVNCTSTITDEALYKLNPYDDNLTKEEKIAIIEKCKSDPTYFMEHVLFKERGKIEVINIKDKKKYAKDKLVYIGRGSIFGNPFHIKTYGREGCIAKYKEYMEDKLKEDDMFYLELLYLAYRVVVKREDIYLMCYCKPLACHGDILKEKLEEYISKMMELKP
jgi:hypothetical protein